MRLTQVLRIIFPKKKVYHGLVDQGKNAKPKRVKVSHKIEAANDVAREAQNLIYLNKPYVTYEEQRSYGVYHHADKAKERQAEIKRLRANRKFFPNRNLSEHLETLNTNKKWE